MEILPCFLLVFLWADISTFVSCMESNVYEQNRATLVEKDVKNSIYNMPVAANYAAFDAYASHVVSEAVAEMTKTGSKFIPYRRYDAKMEEELKKLKVYQFVHDMPKPALLNAQFPLNMTPEEIMTAIRAATGTTEIYEITKAGHPTQLFVKGDPALANVELPLPKDKTKFPDHLSFNTEYFANVSPKTYWRTIHELLKYLEPLLKIEEVIEHMMRVNIESLEAEHVEYVEFRAFFPVAIYKLNDMKTATRETFPEVVQRVVQKYNTEKGSSFEVKLIFLIDRDLSTETLTLEYHRFLSVYKKPDEGMVVGFDVFGLEKKERSMGEIIKTIGTEHLDVFFAHVGENPSYSEDVLWAGAAQLTRIAGGFTLPYHPVVMDDLMPNLKCLELVPLSRTIIQGVDVLVAPERSIVVSNSDRKDYEKVTIGKGIGRQNLTAQYVAFLLFYQKFHIGWAALKQVVENSMRNARTKRFNNTTEAFFNNKFHRFIKDYSKPLEGVLVK